MSSTLVVPGGILVVPGGILVAAGVIFGISWRYLGGC